MAEAVAITSGLLDAIGAEASSAIVVLASWMSSCGTGVVGAVLAISSFGGGFSVSSKVKSGAAVIVHK